MVELSKANPEIRTLADALKQEIMKFGGVEVSR